MKFALASLLAASVAAHGHTYPHSHDNMGNHAPTTHAHPHHDGHSFTNAYQTYTHDAPNKNTSGHHHSHGDHSHSHDHTDPSHSHGSHGHGSHGLGSHGSHAGHGSHGHGSHGHSAPAKAIVVVENLRSNPYGAHGGNASHGAVNAHGNHYTSGHGHSDNAHGDHVSHGHDYGPSLSHVNGHKVTQTRYLPYYNEDKVQCYGNGLCYNERGEVVGQGKVKDYGVFGKEKTWQAHHGEYDVEAGGYVNSKHVVGKRPGLTPGNNHVDQQYLNVNNGHGHAGNGHQGHAGHGHGQATITVPTGPIHGRNVHGHGSHAVVHHIPKTSAATTHSAIVVPYKYGRDVGHNENHNHYPVVDQYTHNHGDVTHSHKHVHGDNHSHITHDTHDKHDSHSNTHQGHGYYNQNYASAITGPNLGLGSSSGPSYYTSGLGSRSTGANGFGSYGADGRHSTHEFGRRGRGGYGGHRSSGYGGKNFGGYNRFNGHY